VGRYERRTLLGSSSNPHDSRAAQRTLSISLTSTLVIRPFSPLRLALGMPPPPRAGGFPVTHIRNTTSPHWRAWLKPENRCLVPINSFAEYAPEPNPETKKKDVVVWWFALNDDRPLIAWHLDRVQGRPRHEVKTDTRPAP
jgi:putative SOS response-associated peptidase YedK